MPISQTLTFESSPDHPGYISDRYYLMSDKGATNSTSAVGILTDSVSYYPFKIKAAATLSRIAVYCTTAKTNADAGFGIYSNEDGLPKNLLCDTAVFPVATVGVKEAVVSVPVSPNWYWLAAYCYTTPNLATITAYLGNNHLIGQTTPLNTSFNCGIRQTIGASFLSLPSVRFTDAFSLISGAICPQVWFKFQ